MAGSVVPITGDGNGGAEDVDPAPPAALDPGGGGRRPHFAAVGKSTAAALVERRLLWAAPIGGEGEGVADGSTAASPVRRFQCARASSGEGGEAADLEKKVDAAANVEAAAPVLLCATPAPVPDVEQSGATGSPVRLPSTPCLSPDDAEWLAILDGDVPTVDVPAAARALAVIPTEPTAELTDLENAVVVLPLAQESPSAAAEHGPTWNWTEVEVEQKWEEEGIQDVPKEIAVYRALGLGREDDMENESRAVGCSKINRSDPVNYSAAANPTMDDVAGEGRIFYDMDNPIMTPGSLYRTVESFRLSIRQYAINNEFELGTESSNRYKFRGFCRGGDSPCPFRIHARLEMEGSPTFMVIVLNDEHTCHSSSRRGTTVPTNNWVAARALPLLMKEPNLGCSKLRETLMTKYSVQISYDTVWHGKEKALKELFGTWEESFQMLWSWKEAVLEKSPDSVIEIAVTDGDNGEPFFSSFFCALGPCISGFKQGCRPYLAIDATALNGRWNGSLAAAVAVDGHHWMYPVAYGYIGSESGDNWRWWLRQLHKAVGDLPELALCSDAGKGLKKALEEVFPHAERRECFRHLMQNYVKNHYPGSEYMYPAARAYRKESFDHYFEKVKISPKVQGWLKDHHGSLWYRSGFNPSIKVDYVTSNVAESFNSWVKEWKDLPPCDLVEKIREEIMELFHRRRRIGQKLQGKILPLVISFLNARTRGLSHLSIKKADNYVAEVRDNNNVHAKHIVHAALKTCSCGEWQHTGKPCQHALCIIIAQEFRNVRMEDFVDDYFTVEKYVKAYERIVEPLCDKSLWPKVEYASQVVAPIGKRAAGRQWKNRMKSALEGGSVGKSKRKMTGEGVGEGDTGRKAVKRKYRCPNCQELGHRASSYKCKLNGTKKRTYKPRPNVTKGWFPKEAAEASSSSQPAAPPSPQPGAAPPSPQPAAPPPESPPRPPVRKRGRKITPKKRPVG